MINKAPISEIFSSIQGEGIFVGVRQIFIRFSGCNLDKCIFCDEDAFETSSMTVEEVSAVVRDLSKKSRPHSVSLTGGEPLARKISPWNFTPLQPLLGRSSFNYHRKAFRWKNWNATFFGRRWRDMIGTRHTPLNTWE